MVELRRRKKKYGSLRFDAITAMFSLVALILVLFYILYSEATREKISIKELVLHEEELVVSKWKELKRQQFVRPQHPAHEDVSDLVSSEEPMLIEEVTEFLYSWVHTLHQELMKNANSNNAFDLWRIYHNLTRTILVPWDMIYLRRMQMPRQDDSIFLSIATYRDENCLNTLSWAYGNATYPERLFVGLVQQNCYENCRSGVQDGGGTLQISPDEDCHVSFCNMHPDLCSQIRPVKLREVESLGPYGARFIASKLYGGEQWFMQMDAHMTFLNGWDDITIKSLHLVPSTKPVIAHYPPGHTMDLVNHWGWRPAGRLCGPIFSRVDGDMIRLEGLRKWDTIKIPIPRFAPFVGAGFLIGTSLLLKEVPFDPFLPWIFMGEEIIMSTRFWTHGYDMFSPAQAVVGHIYVRKNKPKFWETMARFFPHASHYNLEAMVLLRIKHQLGYPEASKDFILDDTILSDLAHYSMGSSRSVESYMKYAGIDVVRKEIYLTNFCEKHLMPPGKETFAKLYAEAEAESRKNATLVLSGK
jgi:[Skp1-protein]-hydroxyproline N-acetylglucosaminyltransferase